MKKLMIALAAVAMTCGLSARAQDNKNAICDNSQCKVQQCDQRGACAFDNLNLTDTQKGKIKALHEKRVADRQARREANAKAKAEKKDQKRTTRVEAKKAYLKDIKSILTPEQYTLFLENSFVNNAPKGPRGLKGMKPGKRNGNRPDCNRADCNRADCPRNGK